MRREESAKLHPAYYIELHQSEPSITKEQAGEASKRIYCPPGKVLVVCHKARTKIGMLHLPDEFAEQFKADLATVVQAGEGVPLKPGDVVVTDWQLGKRVRGLEFADVLIEGEVRMYGYMGGTEMDSDEGCAALAPQKQDWDLGIVGVMEGPRATGKNIWLKVPPLEEASEGGILMAQTAQRRECLWPVHSIGPDVPKADAKRFKGKKVCVHTGDIRLVVTDDGVEFAIVHYEDPVYFIAG